MGLAVGDFQLLSECHISIPPCQFQREDGVEFLHRLTRRSDFAVGSDPFGQIQYDGGGVGAVVGQIEAVEVPAFFNFRRDGYCSIVGAVGRY